MCAPVFHLDSAVLKWPIKLFLLCPTLTALTCVSTEAEAQETLFICYTLSNIPNVSINTVLKVDRNVTSSASVLITPEWSKLSLSCHCSSLSSLWWLWKDLCEWQCIVAFTHGTTNKDIEHDTHLKSSQAQSSSGHRHKCWSLRCRCHDLNTGPDTWLWQSHSWLHPNQADSDTRHGCTPHGLNNWGLCSPLETERWRQGVKYSIYKNSLYRAHIQYIVFHHWE